MQSQKISIGISSCLLGEEVRYDGGHKRNSYICLTLGDYFNFVPFCPEVGIGLGVPRPTIRLVDVDSSLRAQQSNNPSNDVTKRLIDYAEKELPNHKYLSGYILKNHSPSCGMEYVPVYLEGGIEKRGVGIYAEKLMNNMPLLPVEEEDRLGDARLRGNFIRRVCVYTRWQKLKSKPMTFARLKRFHVRHKLITMSHDQNDVHALGEMLDEAKGDSIEVVASDYIARLMVLLKKPATCSNHVNVLQHIQDHLKKELEADEKQELYEVIENYRVGKVPLIAPITLLKHHFRKVPDKYITDSYYMAPYPAELYLLNAL